MKYIGKFAYHFFTLFIPLMSASVVAGSIYYQGMGSPFVGIFLGIAGLFFAIKYFLWTLAKIDDALEFYHTKVRSRAIAFASARKHASSIKVRRSRQFSFGKISALGA